jgi:hypothetical protein
MAIAVGIVAIAAVGRQAYANANERTTKRRIGPPDSAGTRPRGPSRSALVERLDDPAYAGLTIGQGVAAGSSLVLWKGFDQGTESAENFVGSMVVGELQI